MIGADITASTLEELGIQNVKMHFLCFLPVFELTSSQRKLVTNYVLEWMGLNFYYYDGLQPKMRAAIINEHECNEKLPVRNDIIKLIIFIVWILVLVLALFFFFVFC